MKEYEKAEAGLLYDTWKDPEIDEGRRQSQKWSYRYNHLPPWCLEEREALLRAHLGHAGKNILIEQPFRCDFWERMSVGDNFYANYNFISLNGNKVTFGDNVCIGPNCGIYAAGHPFDVNKRNAGIEYGWPVEVGDNVWIGGHVVILGGVKIGDDSIIAAGSVVTKSIPAGVLAAGNPCRVIRKITPEDDEKYIRGFQGFGE